jgi:hypothetical protein
MMHAAACFKAALRFVPKSNAAANSAAHNNLGMALVDERNPDAAGDREAQAKAEARTHFDAALRLDPTNEYAQENLDEL